MAEGGGGDKFIWPVTGDASGGAVKNKMEYKDENIASRIATNTSNEHQLDSSSHGMLLKKLGFFDELKDKYPGIHIPDCNTKITWTGKSDAFENCKREIAKFLSRLRSESWKLSPLVEKLLLRPEVCKYINSFLKMEGIVCVWNVSTSGQIQIWSHGSSTLKPAVNKIKEFVKENRFPLIQANIFKGTEEEKLCMVILEGEKFLTVAATSDIMDKLCRQVAEFEKEQRDAHTRSPVEKLSRTVTVATVTSPPGAYPGKAVTSPGAYPGKAQAQENHCIQLSQLEVSLVTTLKILDYCSNIPAGSCRIDKENCRILIQAAPGNLRNLIEDVQRRIDEVKRQKEKAELQGECGMLLEYEETRKYLNEILDNRNHMCFWEPGSDGHSVNVYSLEKTDAKNAAETISSSFSVVPLDGTVEFVLQQEACRQVFQKHQGKVEILFPDTKDACLVATSDVTEEILQLIKDCQVGLTHIVVPTNIMEYLFITQRRFIRNMKEKYGVHIKKDEEKCALILKGPKDHLPGVKKLLLEHLEKLSTDERRFHVIPTEIADDKNMDKFGAIHNCHVSVERQQVNKRPRPSHVWRSPEGAYLMLVQGNIADTDVDVVVCPVDAKVNPAQAGKEITRQGGKVLLDDLAADGAGMVSASEPYFSSETGNLHCPYIMYAVFPSEADKGSAMSMSETVIVKSIKQVLEKANSQGVYSLAIPLDLSSVVSLATCVHALADCLVDCLKQLTHLREFYMYCPDGTKDSNLLDHARKTLNDKLDPESCENIDFSQLIKEVGVRSGITSPIKLEIVSGSLTDQQVDILVNTTSRKLNLGKGFVSRAIIKIAGSGIQNECNKEYKDGINYGDVAVTSAGKFASVKHIFHVVLPSWRPTGNFSLMVLELLVTKCLMYADKVQLQRIAFPALGIGNLEYPCHLVAKTMCDTIEKYGSSRKTNIRNVKIVAFKSEVFETFKKTEKYKEFGCNETDENGAPYRIMEARIPRSMMSVRVQILPFNGCQWHVQALVDIVPLGKVEQGHQHQELKENGFASSWVSNDSHHYLKIVVTSDSDDSINKGVKKALSIAADERIMSLGFVVVELQCPITKKKLSCKDQASVIKKQIIEVKEENEYLQEVKVFAKSRQDFDVLIATTESKRESEAKATFTGMKKTFKWTCNLLMYRTKCPWKIVRYIKQSDVGFHVTVVGQKQDVNCAVKELDLAAATQHGDGTQESIGSSVDKQPMKKGDIQKNSEYHMKTNGSIPLARQPSLQETDVFEAVEADVNPAIVHTEQWATAVEGHAVHCDDKGHVTCRDLQGLQNVDDVLKKKFTEPPFHIDDTVEHFRQGRERIGEINIGMTEEWYLILLHFCSKDQWTKQNSFKYSDGSLQVSCKDKTLTDTIKTSITSKVEHLKRMNRDEYAITADEQQNVKKTIGDINGTVDNVFCYQLENDERSMIHIMAMHYEALQTAKHKLSLGLGRIKQTQTRRNRRFDNTGDGPSADKNRFSQSMNESRSSGLSRSNPTFCPVNAQDFTTREGLRVRVYADSILHLDVDCIVNAANENLLHGGGVAQVISNAAGYNFDRESRDYVARYGSLRVGEVCTTSAGNLRYKGVIHAVGPRWYDYRQDQQRECLADLKKAVKESLHEADRKGFRSIAIPAISSGIFAVPKELCTQEYYRAVTDYSANRGPRSTLTEVHFIDKDKHMCQLIQTTFTKCFAGNGGATGGGTTNTDHGIPLSMSFREARPQKDKATIHRSLSSDNSRSPVDSPSPGTDRSYQDNQPKTPSDTGGQTREYMVGNKVTVHVVHGNIIQSVTDAVVSPENRQCDSTGKIATEIAKVAGEKYIQYERSEIRSMSGQLGMTEAVKTGAGDSRWRYVIHVVAPRWDEYAVKKPQEYEKLLKQSYENVFLRMDHLKLTSLALPVLGTGSPTYTTPYTTISRAIVCASKALAEKTISKKDIYIYSTDVAMISPLRDVFDKEFGVDWPEDDQGSNSSQTGGANHDDGKAEAAGDCCICMDTINNPKTLSCGHVFCTGCIDQCFTFKPACPQCGAVHGKIIGDQPRGTMTKTTTKPSRYRGTSLPGYEGHGIINITYNFPADKQGPDHPTPGKHYQGITRPGFLPDNDKGRLVARLLRIAFDRNLVFTIGTSRTTGQDGVVTWNDIHHKTRMEGGPQAFGYPDPGYLDRVLDELKAKGVTEESLNDP